jgi:hypothetical protein
LRTAPEQKPIKQQERAMRTILAAIKTAHEGKDKKLNVVHYRNYSRWDPEKDNGHIQYANAMNYLSDFPKLLKFLQAINYL